MQFDHLERQKKTFNISEWSTYILNYELLLEEIKKCDLICSNCHLIRTYFFKDAGKKYWSVNKKEQIEINNLILEKISSFVRDSDKW